MKFLHTMLRVGDMQRSVDFYTRKIERVRRDGAMVYRTEEIGDAVLLFASNVYSDLRWFETAENCHLVIGPRGGIRRKSGSMARWI